MSGRIQNTEFPPAADVPCLTELPEETRRASGIYLLETPFDEAAARILIDAQTALLAKAGMEDLRRETVIPEGGFEWVVEEYLEAAATVTALSAEVSRLDDLGFDFTPNRIDTYDDMPLPVTGGVTHLVDSVHRDRGFDTVIGTTGEEDVQTHYLIPYGGGFFDEELFNGGLIFGGELSMGTLYKAPPGFRLHTRNVAHARPAGTVQAGRFNVQFRDYNERS